MLSVRSPKRSRSRICSEQGTCPNICIFAESSGLDHVGIFSRRSTPNCSSNQHLALCFAGAPRSCSSRLCGAGRTAVWWSESSNESTTTTPSHFPSLHPRISPQFDDPSLRASRIRPNVAPPAAAPVVPAPAVAVWGMPQKPWCILQRSWLKADFCCIRYIEEM